ncbi:GntR family transcriptional regulator [Caproiciproducens sp.]
MDATLIPYEKTEKSKSQAVYKILKEQIITNQLKAGTLLVERQLCMALNTSRSPIREAIQRLIMEGLVISLGTSGNMVSEIRYEDIARIYDIREYLEGLAARLCAQSLRSDQIQELWEIYHTMENHLKLQQYDQYFDTDNQMHNYIVEHSGNDLLIRIHRTNLDGQIRRITRLIERNRNEIRKAQEYHLKLITALENHDGERAEKLLRTHIRNSKINHLHLFAPNILGAHSDIHLPGI